MFDFIEKVIYINLEHRTDRRAEIEHVLSAIPSEKILRFNAIKESHGGIGCTKSHIAVLELAIANKWKNYLVVEDDAVWSKNAGPSYDLLLKLIQNPYDVITLGTVYAKHNSNYKLNSGQTTTAYIVQKHYYETLLQNFKEGLQGFLETGNYPVYSIDQYWKRIQPRDNWYCVIPSLMIQRAGYSDIEKSVINNGQYFS
jgi:glycosyl transferase family 25